MLNKLQPKEQSSSKHDIIAAEHTHGGAKTNTMSQQGVTIMLPATWIDFSHRET